MSDDIHRVGGKNIEPMTVDLGTIAAHEPGHAVMRWLRGRRATKLTATETGGFCEGDNELISPECDLLITLARYAVGASERMQVPADTAARDGGPCRPCTEGARA